MIPREINLKLRLGCQTLSKSFWKSRITMVISEAKSFDVDLWDCIHFESGEKMTFVDFT